MIEKRIGRKNDTPDFYIDEYPLFKYNSVQEIISCNHTNTLNIDFDYGWNIIYDETNINIEQYYFCIEHLHDEAFGHWVYESSIFLVIFYKLKVLYPNIKILNYLAKRNFKKCIYNSFTIKDDEIIYNIENKNNCIIFPRYTTHHDGNLGNLENLYDKYLTNYYNYIVNKIPSIQKDISILYFPRGTLENYKGNDRTIVKQNEIIELIKTYNNSLVYFTDTTTNIVDQITLLKRAKIFITDYGSSFIVNSFFCENSRIIILGNDIAHILFPAGKLIMNNINNNNNNIMFIANTGDKFEFDLNILKNTIDLYYNMI